MSRYYASSLQRAVSVGKTASDDDTEALLLSDVPNFAVAVRLALGQAGLEELTTHVSDGGWEGYDAAAKLGWIETEEKKRDKV